MESVNKIQNHYTLLRSMHAQTHIINVDQAIMGEGARGRLGQLQLHSLHVHSDKLNRQCHDSRDLFDCIHSTVDH